MEAIVALFKQDNDWHIKWLKDYSGLAVVYVKGVGTKIFWKDVSRDELAKVVEGLQDVLERWEHIQALP